MRFLHFFPTHNSAVLALQFATSMHLTVAEQDQIKKWVGHQKKRGSEVITTSDPGKDQQSLGNLELTCLMQVEVFNINDVRSTAADPEGSDLAVPSAQYIVICTSCEASSMFENQSKLIRFLNKWAKKQ